MFKTQPMRHQLECFDRQKDEPSFALFLEMGLGKTKIAIDTVAHLFRRKEIRNALVIAPNGVHLAWEAEIIKHLADDVGRRVFIWKGGLGSKELYHFNRSAPPDTLTILLMNIEALSTSERARDAARAMVRESCIGIVDESTRIKNPGAARTKFVAGIGRRCQYKRILTGTPVTQSPFDLYSQFEFLGKEILGFGSFSQFRHRYGEFSTEVGRQGGKEWSYQKLTAYRRMDELTRLIEPKSIRMRKEDCLDLPEKIYQVIPIPLTTEQRKLYKSMDKEGVAEFDSFEVLSPLRITRLTKMAQIASGFIIGEDGRAVTIDGGNPKMAVLMDLIREMPESSKMIVSCRFRHEIRMIVDALREIGRVVEYHGDTSVQDRVRNVQAFQEDSSTRFLVGQERALIGITLTAADVMIFWSNEFSYEARYQCEDRAHRIGQTKSVVYIDLVGEKTVEERVVQVLDRCRSIADQLVDGAAGPDRLVLDPRGKKPKNEPQEEMITWDSSVSEYEKMMFGGGHK